MEKKSGFSVDAKDFLKGLTKLDKQVIPQASSDGLMRAGAHVLRDAILQEPRAPHKSGNLWRNQKIETPVIKRGDISLIVGFNTPYAGRVHELPETTNWTLKGSGPKYLESKLSSNKADYAEDVAKSL